MTLLLAFTSCSSDPFKQCSSNTAVASYTLQFSSGLDNFSEDQYTKLRKSTSDVLGVVNAAIESTDSQVSTAAKDLKSLLTTFENKMQSFSWDISQALNDATTNEAASALATADSLKKANIIESFVIDTCGMPSTVEFGSQSADTLPMPSIPQPNETDPPANTINEQSEDIALGTTVANLFNLTLNEKEVSCLGSALKGVYDTTSSGSSNGAYQSQFQKAFDSCSIPFVVPSN